jgi:hypothetical protein
MGYWIELGYPEKFEVLDGMSDRDERLANYDLLDLNFVCARVNRFTGGSTLPLGRFNGDGELIERPTGEDCLVDASIHVTSNYSGIIRNVIGTTLSGLDALKGSEAFPLLLILDARLEGQPADDSWQATPGNVKQMAQTLGSWSLQHPDAYFRTY